LNEYAVGAVSADRVFLDGYIRCLVHKYAVAAVADHGAVRGDPDEIGDDPVTRGACTLDIYALPQVAADDVCIAAQVARLAGGATIRIAADEIVCCLNRLDPDLVRQRGIARRLYADAISLDLIILGEFVTGGRKYRTKLNAISTA